MKKIIVAAMAILVLVSGIAAAQSLPTITIINNTGKPMRYLYVVPKPSDVMFLDEVWGEDLLPKDMLENGASIDIQLKFPLSQESIYYIKLIGDGGPYYIKYDVKVSNKMKITFKASDLWKDSGPTVSVVNNTGNTVWYVYATYYNPAAGWGHDRLNSEEELPNGGTKTFRLPGSGPDTYDFCIVDSNKNRYVKMGIKVTPNMKITFTKSDLNAGGGQTQPQPQPQPQTQTRQSKLDIRNLTFWGNFTYNNWAAMADNAALTRQLFELKGYKFRAYNVVPANQKPADLNIIIQELIDTVLPRGRDIVNPGTTNVNDTYYVDVVTKRQGGIEGYIIFLYYAGNGNWPNLTYKYRE